MADKEIVESAIRSLEATSRTIDFWILMFGIVVAFALAAETVLGVWHWVNERQLRPLRQEQARAHEDELARLENDTGRLFREAEAEAARSQIAEARARAAEANRIAEEEKNS